MNLAQPPEIERIVAPDKGQLAERGNDQGTTILYLASAHCHACEEQWPEWIDLIEYYGDSSFAFVSVAGGQPGFAANGAKPIRFLVATGNKSPEDSPPGQLPKCSGGLRTTDRGGRCTKRGYFGACTQNRNESAGRSAGR
jgi:hypothetical protein